MKKRILKLSSILFIGLIGFVMSSNKTIVTNAINNQVALSSVPASNFASGEGNTVSYSNDGIKMIINGASTSGSSSAWSNHALIPSKVSNKNFSLVNNNSVSIEISANLFASTGEEISKSQNSDALDIYILKSNSDIQVGMLRIWTNAWGSLNGNHSYNLYGNDWNNQGAGLAIMGNATENSSFYIQIDKENFISSYVAGQSGLVPLGNESIINERKEVLKDVDEVYFKIQGENGFTNDTQITIKNINGQSLANDGTNLVDNVAPIFDNVQVSKTLKANEPYEIPTSAHDLLSDVTYKLLINNQEIEGKTFTPTINGVMDVILIATDSAGNTNQKQFSFEITDGIEKPVITLLPTINDMEVDPLTYITFGKPTFEDSTGEAKVTLSIYNENDELIDTLNENSNHEFSYFINGKFTSGKYKLVYNVTNSAGTTTSDDIFVNISIKEKDIVNFISTSTDNMIAEYGDDGIVLSSSDNYKHFNLGVYDLNEDFNIKFIVNEKTINNHNNDTNYVNLVLISEENNDYLLMYRVWVDHSSADRPTNVYLSTNGGSSFTDITDTGWISRNVDGIKDCYHMGFNKDDTFFGERTGGIQRVDNAYNQLIEFLSNLTSKKFSVRLEASNLNAGEISNFEIIIKDINTQNLKKPIVWEDVKLTIQTDVPEVISLDDSLDIDVYAKDIQDNVTTKLVVVDPNGETTENEIIDGKINYHFDKLGDYTLTFIATGSNGNEVKKSFKITCKSSTSPVEINVNGQYESTYELNASIKVYDATYSANVVKSSISIVAPSGEKTTVNANDDYIFTKPGIYKIIYFAEDNAEPIPNSTSREFVINVPDTLKPVVEVDISESYHVNDEIKVDLKVVDDSEYDVTMTLTKPDGTSEKLTNSQTYVFKATIEGKYELKVVVEDVYGNKEIITKEFNVFSESNNNLVGLILGITGGIIVIGGIGLTTILLKKKKNKK